MAKLTFWEMSPFVATITFSAFSFDVTTPIRLPLASTSGPPDLPSWTGAEIWK